MTEPTDSCGTFLTAECVVPVPPYAVQPEGTESVRAWYRCGGCGHGWFTGYILGAEETERVLAQAGTA
jgi:hypothetical protein